MQSEQVKYEMILQASAPVSHCADTFGNTQVHATQRVSMPDGSFANVPIVSGNSLRHHLRETLANQCLAAAGIAPGELSLTAIRFLYSGGNLSSESAKRVSIAGYRSLCELMPGLGLFGGAVGSRLEAGRTSVQSARLICTETAHTLPEWVHAFCAEHGRTLMPARAHIEEVQRVNMDPALRPEHRRMLRPADLAEAEAIVDGDESSAMMPYTFETVVEGSLWFWSIAATIWSEVERDALHCAVLGWLAEGKAGGKSGAGCGAYFRPVSARGVHLADVSPTRQATDLIAPGHRVGDVLRAAMADRREEVLRFLEAL